MSRVAFPVLLILALSLGLACAAAPAPAPRIDVAAPLDGAKGTYRVFLPPDHRPGVQYPVLYFLHDFFGDSGILWRSGAIEEIRRRMAAGEMEPLVLVAPDGRKSFWSDFHDGSRAYETWVAEVLPGAVEARLGLSAPPRALAGISMGGYGALKIALKHPHLYGSAGSLSGAVQPLNWEGVLSSPIFLRPQLKKIYGRSATDNSLAENDLARLLSAPWPPGVARPELLLRCGTEDKYDLDEAARTFAEAARGSGFEVDLVLEPGKHDWNYWRRSAVELVAWHAARFAEERR